MVSIVFWVISRPLFGGFYGVLGGSRALLGGFYDVMSGFQGIGSSFLGCFG